MERLKVSENKRFLVKESGEQFFWLGDTAWELVHSLSREEIKTYLDCRKEQGFTVIQTVALAECDGLRVPNFYGRCPLVNKDGDYSDVEPDTAGEYSYWDHVDYFIQEAEKYDMYVALLPTWGDKYNNRTFGVGPKIFGPEKAEAYAAWIGNRYKDKDNIVWVLGGDRLMQTAEHFAVNDALARGLKKGGATQLITLHPPGAHGSSGQFPDTDWLDFHMYQTGHDERNRPTYEFIAYDYALPNVKPTLDAEPRYEDHPVGFQSKQGYFDDYDVRQAVYWSVFAGACGVTYGHHCIWRIVREVGDYFIMPWETALTRPGAWQMRYLKDLILEDDMLTMRPAQQHLHKQYEGANYVAVLESDKKIYCYTPAGLQIELEDSASGKKAVWMKARTGERCEAVGKDNVFLPPMAGRNEDWVLIIEK